MIESLAEVIEVFDEVLSVYGYSNYVATLADIADKMYGPSNCLKTLANGNTNCPDDVIATFRALKQAEVQNA